MPSVKLQPDTLAILSGLRARFGCGQSYDKIIQELVRRHLHEINQSLLAPDRLERIEAMLIQLVQRTEDDGDGGNPKLPTVNVE
jgi:hypothetical protein